MNEEPKVLRLGDGVNTDDIIPAARCTSSEPDHLRRYALEYIVGVDGLIGYNAIEAGRNFGCGSSRENAPIAIQAAGVQKVTAESFAQIFYRNSINIGLPLATWDQLQIPPLVQSITDAGGLTKFNFARRAGQVSAPLCDTPARPMTVAEKLLARASGNAYVQAGDMVFAKVDLAMSHDAVIGPVAKQFYGSFGRDARVWDPEKLVLVADHFIQVNDIRTDGLAPILHDQLRKFGDEQGCKVLDVAAPGDAIGICHVVLPELGYIRPGMIIAGTDSHTCTYGAFGCFSTGVGTTDMANVLAMGDMWIRVPETIRIELTGKLSANISAKDVMLFLLGQIGCDGAKDKVLEFCGPVVETMPIDERMTLSNMAIECGAMCGFIAPDEKTLHYLNCEGAELDLAALTNDERCKFDRILQYDLTSLRPMIACPPSPDKVVSVSELGHVPITKAYIGSCTGGKLHDLAEAAEVLRGRKVAAGVRLYVVPASQVVRKTAEELGYMQIFRDAGGEVLKSGCGACINAGMGNLDKDETGVYATNRNFKGRSGDPSANNYLASPRVVAASAIHGKITDEA
jgi:homoaconitate hydratase family protein